MIRTGRRFSANAPAVVEEALRAEATPWGWAAARITDQEFIQMLPPWLLQECRQQGEGGEEWLQDLVRWVRSLFVPAGTRVVFRRDPP